VSRLGKSPIALPKGVELKLTKGLLTVKGPKGSLERELPEGISVSVEDNQVIVIKDEGVEMPKAFYGLYRSLVGNMIVGVSKGFEKRLSLVGVGYRAAVQGAVLDLQLGFSHPTQIKIPKSLNVAVDKSVSITITGVDKHTVGQFAAAVRAKRPPEPYKGKGIRYENEYVRKKAGKAAKGKTA
jgi:large subunit ribosomal protein L6